MPDSQFNEYFHGLEQGAPIRCIETFRENVSARFAKAPTPSILVQDFYRAARAGSLEPKTNSAAFTPLTRRAHYMLSRKTLSLFESMGDRWDMLSADDLEKIILAHKRIQTVPSSEILSKWLNVTYDKLEGMSADFLGKCVNHLADLGVYPGDAWIVQWYNAVKPKSADLGWQKVCAVLYKLALLDYLRQSSIKSNALIEGSPCIEAADMFLKLLEKHCMSVFSSRVDSRFYYAALWFKRDFINSLPIESSSDTSSRLEKSVLNQIRTAKLMVDEDGIKIGKTSRKVDLRVSFHGTDIGCEVDGVLHFIARPHENAKENLIEYNTSTRFHAALTRALCPDLKILRVPYFVLDYAREGQLPWEKTFAKVYRGSSSHYSLESGSSIRDVQKSGYIFKGRTL